MSFFHDWFGWLFWKKQPDDNLGSCVEEKLKITELEDQIKLLEKQNEHQKKKYNECNAEKNTLNKECDDAIKTLQEELKKETVSLHEKLKYWETKHPKADITYGRYVMDENKKIKFTNIDVKLFLTPKDFEIKNQLKKWETQARNPLKCNKEILKIYKKTREGYHYNYDEPVYGFGEIWLFPYELRLRREHGKGGDCEDYAHELASYLIAAGIPKERVRVVCGNIKGNPKLGHSTVYVLGDDLETWYHLNSTSPSVSATNLTDMPTSKTKGDYYGIGNVWFSFSSHAAWHEFETKASATSFAKEKEMKKIKIKPLRAV